MSGYARADSRSPPRLRDAKRIARALRTLADATGRPFTVENKADRIRAQKAVYLLKSAGYPSASVFSFNVYLNGPYSPDLTRAYFELGDSGLHEASPATDLPPGFVETFKEADGYGIEFLEALTTVLNLNQESRNLGQALGWARAMKPHIPAKVWLEVRSFLPKHLSLTRST
jgi:hypothetical protein